MALQQKLRLFCVILPFFTFILAVFAKVIVLQQWPPPCFNPFNVRQGPAFKVWWISAAKERDMTGMKTGIF